MFSSNYELYGELTGRVVSIIRQEAPAYFRYSIDESFVYLDGMENVNLKQWGEDLHKKIKRYVGMPVSIGLAPNKTLAKMASHFAKKYQGYRHCCMIDSNEKRIKALKLYPIDDVWGIGRRYAAKLQALGINTAYDFAQHHKDWVRLTFNNINIVRTWQELNGEDVVPNEELAKKNADMVLAKDRDKIKREELRTIGAMNQVASWIGLTDIHRVEAYDISNISGFESVGSMVVFENGKPKRNDYRKFRIRTVQGPNDYASMKEVLTRRFSHGIDEAERLRAAGQDVSAGSFTRFPDLLMMDGGRGQVNIALEVLSELKLSIPVCGMVKDDHHRTRGLYYNNVEIPIDTRSEGFKLITRVQDEAHRFAIEYHRSLRSKEQVHSVLDDIPGIGPKRRLALMRAFRSFEAVRSASVEELSEVPSMNLAAAEKVYAYFHGREEGTNG